MSFPPDGNPGQHPRLDLNIKTGFLRNRILCVAHHILSLNLTPV